MDEEMLLEWIDLVWEPATEGQRAMLVLDSFSAHITPAVKQKLKSINTVPLVIPGGCTSKIQPLDVSLNKPFKSYVRKYWSDFVLQQATNLQKLKPPTKQNVAKWVSTALDELQEKPDMVVRSFSIISEDIEMGLLDRTKSPFLSINTWPHISVHLCFVLI